MRQLTVNVVSSILDGHSAAVSSAGDHRDRLTAVATQGKQKVFRGVKGVRNETKKAIVTLAEGQSIDVTAGI